MASAAAASSTQQPRGRGTSTTTTTSPSTNASSKTYLLFISTILFATMTTNFIHHQLADPHNIHTRANLKFHEQMRLMETTAAATTTTKKKMMKQRLGRGKGIEQAVEVEQETEVASSESESASSAAVAVATTESSSVSIDKNIPGGATPTDQSQLLVGNEEENEAHDPLQEQPPPPPLHELSGLSCHDHNGPFDELATAEMVYWKDIPSDSSFKSPIGNEVGNRMYLTFEPDGKRRW